MDPFYDSETVKFLCFLYDQAKRGTPHRGFNQFDRPFFSSVVWYLAKKRAITENQERVAVRRLQKYKKNQLTDSQSFDVRKFLDEWAAEEATAYGFVD